MNLLERSRPLNAAEAKANSDRTLFRVGGAVAVIGAVMAVIGNVAHPREKASNLGHPAPYVKVITGSDIWLLAHIDLILVSLFFLGGWVALTRALHGSPGEGLARIGLAFAIVDTAMHTVTLTIDGVVMKSAADAVVQASAGGQTPGLEGFSALFYLLFGLFHAWVVVWGGTFMFFGLAVLVSRRFPTWLGYVALVGGIGLSIVGMVDLSRGVSEITFLILFPWLAGTLSVWVATIGIHLWRDAGRVGAAST